MNSAVQLEQVDFFRLDAGRKTDSRYRAELGQFLTPTPLANFMASLFQERRGSVRLLDAGAGVGSLFAAYVMRVCQSDRPAKDISITAYEIDSSMLGYLHQTTAICESHCAQADVDFSATILNEDFLDAASGDVSNSLFNGPAERFNAAILNPPYKKIRSTSAARSQLRDAGIETSNLYAGFLALTVRLLEPGGELVAITPRSFCNGPYFRPFRESFLRDMELRHLHVFESRQKAFSDDEVLQENVIVYAIKRKPGADDNRPPVVVSSSSGPDDDVPLYREVPYQEVVRPGDRQSFIHVAADTLSEHVADRMASLGHTLADLGIQVSTGRVVDFRAKEFLREVDGDDVVPLVWPTHFDQGYIHWPKLGRKPNYIVADDRVIDQLVPNETYVLVRRFSAKEERRRVVAAIYDPERARRGSPTPPLSRPKVSEPRRNVAPMETFGQNHGGVGDPRPARAEVVGFENHLNYFHSNGRGLDPTFARGLAAFLNSTLVDAYVRQFSGHTQVNATDLRNLSYPSEAQLLAIGRRIGDTFPEQSKLDELVSEELHMANAEGIDPAQAREKIEAALSILKDLGFPRAQQNERSALTLLSLLDLTANKPWSKAKQVLRGITPMMDFFAENYGKRYAPNSRETVRRQTVHQFLDAGLVVVNPDEPNRPINSGNTVYQIEQSVLELLRTFGTRSWKKNLKAYLASAETLAKRYAQERQMTRIPLQLPGGNAITLSPGGQNVLIEKIMSEFAACFTPGGVPLYVGDTDEKFAHFDVPGLKNLGVEIESHGKMPDVIIHYTAKNWLVLVEAVTSHGPIDPKRRDELRKLFEKSSAGLVYVTAFLTRKTMVQYLGDISWETEVWVAESPTHMIHFNGERFLGPYSQSKANLISNPITEVY